MLHAFVYTEVTVLVRHWFEVSVKDSHLEHGTRVELRVREPQPHRGSESAAQRIVADRPYWRADLFDLVEGDSGGFEAAHFHPHFRGVEPCERHWEAAVNTTPWEWLGDRLSDVAALAEAAGVPLEAPAADVEQIRADTPAIVAAAQGRAGERCTSTQQCYAWTEDAAPIVHLMLDRLARPDLLDRGRLAPWLASQPA